MLISPLTPVPSCWLCWLSVSVKQPSACFRISHRWCEIWRRDRPLLWAMSNNQCHISRQIPWRYGLYRMTSQGNTPSFYCNPCCSLHTVELSTSTSLTNANLSSMASCCKVWMSQKFPEGRYIPSWHSLQPSNVSSPIFKGRAKGEQDLAVGFSPKLLLRASCDHLGYLNWSVKAIAGFSTAWLYSNVYLWDRASDILQDSLSEISQRAWKWPLLKVMDCTQVTTLFQKKGSGILEIVTDRNRKKMSWQTQTTV